MNLKTISKNSFSIDKKKIVIRERKPNKLETELLESEEGFHVLFNLSGGEYNSCVGHMIKFGAISEEEAKKKYEKILDKLKKGKYRVDLYVDGRYDIKLTR